MLEVVDKGSCTEAHPVPLLSCTAVKLRHHNPRGRP